MNHTAEVWWLQSLLLLFNHVTISSASQNRAPFSDIHASVVLLPQEQGKHWKMRLNWRILRWWERTHELERDFPFHHSAQKTQDEDCPTFKCPLLHTTAANSLWATSRVKYNYTFTLHTRIVIPNEVTPGDEKPRGCNEKDNRKEKTDFSANSCFPRGWYFNSLVEKNWETVDERGQFESAGF